MKNIAIILAGGIGSRLDVDIPKQFLSCRYVSIGTYDFRFSKHDMIDEIAIVVNNAYRGKIESYIIKNNFSKVKILTSGTERHFLPFRLLLLMNRKKNVI